MNKPEQLKDKEINLSELRKICQEYIDACIKKDQEDLDELPHYIFEEVLVALYGEGIFDFINNKLEDDQNYYV